MCSLTAKSYIYIHPQGISISSARPIPQVSHPSCSVSSGFSMRSVREPNRVCRPPFRQVCSVLRRERERLSGKVSRGWITHRLDCRSNSLRAKQHDEEGEATASMWRPRAQQIKSPRTEGGHSLAGLTSIHFERSARSVKSSLYPPKRRSSPFPQSFTFPLWTSFSCSVRGHARREPSRSPARFPPPCLHRWTT